MSVDSKPGNDVTNQGGVSDKQSSCIPLLPVKNVTRVNASSSHHPRMCIFHMHAGDGSLHALQCDEPIIVRGFLQKRFADEMDQSIRQHGKYKYILRQTQRMCYSNILLQYIVSAYLSNVYSEIILRVIHTVHTRHNTISTSIMKKLSRYYTVQIYTDFPRL